MESRCTAESNDWDCWKRKPEHNVFGYYDWTEAGWEFIVQEGKEVEESTWTARCRAVEARCQQGLETPYEGTPSADRSLLSAAVYGHNCHHAAQSVCSCIAEEAPVLSPTIVVLDNAWTGLPQPAGNLYHSLLEIAHPEKEGFRCLVESQWKYRESSVDDRCCYSASGTRQDVVEAQCPLAFTGPFRKKRSFAKTSDYACESFLEQRGVAAGEAQPRRVFLASP